jgi:hypothetical protein
MASNSRLRVSKIDVDIKYAKLRRTLNAPTGEVGRIVRGRAEKARMHARAQVGKRSGALAMSIYIDQSTKATGQQLTIGSNLPYAAFVHEGTRPHLIAPRGGEILRFTQKGRVVYSRAVMHPGTKPNRFLADSAYLLI